MNGTSPLARATGVVTAVGIVTMLLASVGFAVLAVRLHTPGWRPVVTSLHWGTPSTGVAMDTRGHPVLDLGPQQPTVALRPSVTGALVARLGGREVTPDTLVAGREAYLRYCVQCHGDRGDGHGPSAEGLVPPPRDFTTGRFKFAAVPSGALPGDADLARVVRHGLAGTAMRGWDVPADDLTALVQYLKTLSPRWQREVPGREVTPDAAGRGDPWGPAGRSLAVARGERVYHGRALCWTCHPAYETRADITDAVRTLTGAQAVLRDDLHGGVRKREEGYGTDVLAPDFTRQPMRSGETVGDLYRTLSAGVGGTPMPGWRDGLPEADVWALAYYVADLAAMRDTPGATALADTLALADAAQGPTGAPTGESVGRQPRPAPGR